MRTPMPVVNIDDMHIPVEPASAPAPIAKPACPYLGPVSNADIAVVIAVIDVIRVVHGNVNVFRTHRSNRYVVPIRDFHAFIAPQDAYTSGLLTDGEVGSIALADVAHYTPLSSLSTGKPL